MKDQTEQVLATLLERAVQGIDEAVAFSQAQIPDVVEQLLMWKMASSMLLTALGVVLLALFSIILRNHKREYGDYDLIESDSFGVFIVGFFSLIAGALLVLPSVGTWLQILIAPKLYLLEYAARLVG